LSDLRKKPIRFNEKKKVSQHHNKKTDTTELQGKDAEYEQFIKIYMKVQGGNQELEEAQKNSELMHTIHKNVRGSSPDLKIVNVGRTLGQDHVGEPQTESVYEEGEGNEINYDLSIDKNNQTLNLKQRLRREFGSQVEDKEQNVHKDESEQELSTIGKENGEESKEITATTSSTTSTDHKQISKQDDLKSETEQREHSENESGHILEQSQESHKKEDTKDSENQENLNKQINKEVKSEGKELKEFEEKVTIEVLQEFLENYINNYKNFYSERFKHLDLNRNRVENHQVYKELRRRIIKSGQIPHIIYEIYNKKTGWIRIGRSSYSLSGRMQSYLSRAFSPSLPRGLANIYYDMRKCKSKKEALNRFEIKVLYIFPTKGEAQIMEEFLTIYRNKADNHVGYNLAINNEYNKVIGDLFKRGTGGKFLSEKLNPKWKNVPPIALSKAILKGLNTSELAKVFNVSSKTIRRRHKAYGYGVKSKFDLKDARAFLLKPIIIKGFNKGLSQEEFFEYCRNMGIKIFDRYRFILNKPNDRGAFFRRMLKQIWGTSRHKDIRFQVVADYILSVINRPDIMPGEAKTELEKIIKFKYDREFDSICRDVFGMDFRKKRDEIFKPLFEKLALKNKNEFNINLKVAIGLDLCKESDPVKIKERASSWVKAYTLRNYDTTVRNLTKILNPNSVDYLPFRQKVFEYMEDHPINKPMEVIKKFEGENIGAIRNYVKEWKRENRDKVNKFLDPLVIASKSIDKMKLDHEITTKTLTLLKKFKSERIKSFNHLDLKTNPRGIVAGAILLASKMTRKSITQKELKKALGVDEHTISKRYKELKEFI